MLSSVLDVKVKVKKWPSFERVSELSTIDDCRPGAELRCSTRRFVVARCVAQQQPTTEADGLQQACRVPPGPWGSCSPPGCIVGSITHARPRVCQPIGPIGDFARRDAVAAAARTQPQGAKERATGGRQSWGQDRFGWALVGFGAFDLSEAAPNPKAGKRGGIRAGESN